MTQSDFNIPDFNSVKYKHKHFVSISNDIHFKTIGTQTITNEFKSRNVGIRFQSQKIKLDEIHIG